MKNNRRIIGFLIILLSVVVVSMLTIDDYTVYFYTPQEAVGKRLSLLQREISVGGMVKAQSVEWNPKALVLAFTLTDLKGTELRVNHKGIPPDMFKENSGVIIEGYISKNGQSFKASQLFVKHSEEYKIPEQHASNNFELTRSAILK